MEFFIFGLLFFSVFGFSFYKKRRGRIKILKSIAEDLGITYHKGPLLLFPTVSGRIDDSTIYISTASQSSDVCIRIKISKDTFVSLPFVLTTNNSFESYMNSEVSRSFETGDSQFDKKFTVQYKDKHRAIVRLNEKFRNNLLSLIAIDEDLEIKVSGIKFNYKLNTIKDNHQIKKIFKLLIQISDELLKKDEIRLGLIDNIKTESKTPVRLKNIQAYYEKFGNHDETEKLLFELTDDSNFKIRIFAAKMLGDHGIEKLIKTLNEIIEKQLTKHFSEDLCEIINALKNKYNSKTHNAVKRVLAKENDNEILLACFKYCKNIPGGVFTEELLRHIKHRDSTVREEALKIIVFEGNITAVEKLFIEKEKTMNLFWKGELARAIERIQAHSESGEKGWVSLNETEFSEGELTLTDEQKGKISIKEKL